MSSKRLVLCFVFLVAFIGGIGLTYKTSSPLAEPTSGANYIVPPVPNKESVAFSGVNEKVTHPVNTVSASPQAVEIDEALEKNGLLTILRDKSETEVRRNESANVLRQRDPIGTEPQLLQIAADKSENGRFRAFAIQHLSQISSKDSGNAKIEVLRRLLEDSALEVRREALLALCRIRDSAAMSRVPSLLRNGDDNMRDLAIRCARELEMRELLSDVRKFLSSTKEPIQIAAITTLSAWDDMDSVPALEKAALSKNVRVQRAAIIALQRFGLAKNMPVPNDNALGCCGDGQAAPVQKK